MTTPKPKPPPRRQRFEQHGLHTKFLMDTPKGSTITFEHHGDFVRIRGSGNAIGKLAIEPGGSNVFDVRIIE